MLLVGKRDVRPSGTLHTSGTLPDGRMVLRQRGDSGAVPGAEGKAGRRDDGESMKQRTMDEMIDYIYQEVDEMDIDRKYKMALLGMIAAIACENKKQESSAGHEPERKTGHWEIVTKDIHMRWRECSECHAAYDINPKYNYCPKCGAKMEGAEE